MFKKFKDKPGILTNYEKQARKRQCEILVELVHLINNKREL